MLELPFEIRRFALDFTPISADPAVPSNRVVDRCRSLRTGVVAARHVAIHVTMPDDQPAAKSTPIRREKLRPTEVMPRQARCARLLLPTRAALARTAPAATKWRCW